MKAAKKAKQLRDLELQIVYANKLISDTSQKIREEQETCNHDYIVTLNSEWGGSYSYDYEDCHPENRACLVCGFRESQYLKDINYQFIKLVGTPIVRFECWHNIETTPFKDIRRHKLSELLKYCEEHGYKKI